jgi:predicted nucleotidyltransferase
LIGIYIYGSAILGGLHINSDVDILVIINQDLTGATRNETYNLFTSIDKIHFNIYSFIEEVLEWKNFYILVALKTIDIPSLSLLNKFLSMDNYL